MHANGRFLLLTGATAGAVVAAFWLLAAFAPMAFMTPEYAMWRARQQLIARCDLAPVIVQGDSRAAAGFVPARLAPPGGVTNLALGGATPVETFYAMRAILACARPPRQVVISLSPGLFIAPVHFWERAALFQFLSFSDLEEIRRNARAFGETNYYEPPRMADLDAALENALHAAAFPSYYMGSIADHLVVGRWAANRRVLAETVEAGGQHVYGDDAGSSGIADEARLGSFEPSPMLTSYMERLLDTYAARGTEVHFVPVPINQTTFDHLPPALADDFQRYLDGIAARHRNFRVHGRALAPLDDRYFGDMTHLNAQGAAVFSDGVRALFASFASGAVEHAEPRKP